MSELGIKRAAEVFALMQQAHIDLMTLGCAALPSMEGKQDMLLGRMFDKAKDAIKDDFVRLTSDTSLDRRSFNDQKRRDAWRIVKP